MRLIEVRMRVWRGRVLAAEAKRQEVQAKTLFVCPDHPSLWVATPVSTEDRSKIRLESAPIHGVGLCRRSPILGACCWGGIEGCESFLANLANSSESRERPVWQ